MNILIVDDSSNLRKVTRRYLEQSQVECRFWEAGDGEEAERVLQEQHLSGSPIEMIVLDWHMPKVTGFDFLKKLRESEVFAKAPRVIMLTAEQLVKALEKVRQQLGAGEVKRAV